jgi:hypothetical protein
MEAKNDNRMFVITQELAQAILNYLTTKPYREVAGLVQALEGLPRLANPPMKEQPTKEKPK